MFNQLSPGEHERLALLVEEAGEVIQAVGKILRHGWTPIDTNVSPPKEYDNRADLEKELGDLHSAISALCREGDLSRIAINQHSARRSVTVTKYLHHQPQGPHEAKV